VDDVWGVLDHVGAETVVLVGLCSGAGLCLLLAAERPERVQGVVAINPGLPLTPPLPHKLERDFDAVSEADEWLWTHGSRPEGWAKLTRSYWLRDWAGFAEFFFGEMFPEPHSTKQVEDTVSWALETTPEVMLLDDEAEADPRFGVDGAEETCRRVRCPVLVLTGSLDMCQSPERGRLVAELTGGDLVVLEGCGHLPNARDPVKVNLLIRDFVRRVVGLDA
jgi:pimeloyl-ACP methyl ester carboxylesterase